MKKTFFLSSWGAKLAFAAVVLTSPLLTSCEQEELDATFQAAPAKVTLAEYSHLEFLRCRSRNIDRVLCLHTRDYLRRHLRASL